jgi:hypothetical protein
VTICLALAGGVPVVGFAATADAATRVVESTDHVLTGDVTLVDPIAKTVTVRDDDGQLITIVVTVATSVADGARHSGLSDLKAGDRVVVDWDDRTGRNLATYLEVVDEAKSPSPAPVHSAQR